MLLRSLYNGVPIYTTIGAFPDQSQFEHTLRLGDPIVWTGKATSIDALVGPKLSTKCKTFYEVYAPIQETSGWVWSGNVEPVEAS